MPPSQAPWTFTFTFRRPSGGYFQISATLTAVPGTFSTNAVNFSALTYEMSAETTYAADFTLGFAISGAGKFSMVFPSDFIFTAFVNSCTGMINSASITSSTSTCYI